MTVTRPLDCSPVTRIESTLPPPMSEVFERRTRLECVTHGHVDSVRRGI
jgi:hypothetical protein